MAYIADMQEPTKLSNHETSSSWFEYYETKAREANPHSSLSVTSQDALELELTWARDYILRSASSRSNASETRSITATTHAATVTHIPFEFGQTLRALSELSKVRNAVVHNLSHVKFTNFWSNLAFIDILEIARNLEDFNNPPASSYTTNIQLLKQLYLFRNVEEVQNFLEANSFLVSLLKEGYSHIKKYFPYSRVFLEVVTDPEAFDEKQLVAFIVVEQDSDDASEALDQLDEDWWLDAMERAQDKLCVTLEFR